MGNDPSRDEHLSAVFSMMVMQLTNMAAMFLGKVPNPETNQPTIDLDAAGIFIDQLEALEAKTRGNLSKEEADVLKQGLATVRMAFVEAANSPADKKTPPAVAPETQAEDESRKKFTKKY